VYCGRLWRTSDSRGTGTGMPVDTRTKTNKYCDWSNTKVLVVPIALTSIVNITCIAIFALLIACVDNNFNIWWDVVYGQSNVRVEG
jgi:hypothetical protein